MTPVEKLQQEIDSMRAKGFNQSADKLQLKLNSYQASADKAQDELLRRRAEARKKAGF